MLQETHITVTLGSAVGCTGVSCTMVGLGLVLLRLHRGYQYVALWSNISIRVRVVLDNSLNR